MSNSSFQPTVKAAASTLKGVVKWLNAVVVVLEAVQRATKMVQS